MTQATPPLLCLWTRHSPLPGRIAAWQALVPPGTDIVLAATVAGAGAGDPGIRWLAAENDPLSALQAAAQAYPHRDIALANLDAQAPGDFWARLREAAEARPGMGVLVVRGLEGESGNRGNPADVLPPSTIWSSGLSYWRSDALRDIGGATCDLLPESTRGAFVDTLSVLPAQERSSTVVGRAQPARLSKMQARAQFVWTRSTNVLRRTGLSLRQRGLRATIRRVLEELRRRPPPEIASTNLQIPVTAPFAPFAVPRAGEPRASIIVPVYNHFAHTLTCLRALMDCGDQTAFEVIVVDDASSDETMQRMRQIAGVRYLRNAANLGFIGACNAGAAVARGDFLVFLNNDTAVQPGWLDALIGTFVLYPNAGLVGSKLVYPDGRLQEAGGAVFSDASGWNYGRLGDPDAPPYNYVREADYCSGAAIALPRALFEKFGGFDPLYTPAYYEDTDLAMKVHAEGMQVFYQPASAVVHFEGVTSGTDTGSGIKAYQVTNQQKFLARWRDVLASHPAPGEDIRRACEHRATRRVLVIDACTPMPDRDSGSLRMVNLLTLLREEGCAVTFFADNQLHDGAYTHALQQLGVQVWWSPWIGDVTGWFAEHGALFDTVIASRHYVASSYIALVRRYAPKARFVFDTVDLHYLREQREAEIAGDPAALHSAQQTRERELKLIGDSDLTLVVSPVELALLARELPTGNVEVLSNVHRAKDRQAGFDGRHDIVFVGGYRHTPNVDAALWLARDIFPLIRAQRDDIALHLIGSFPTPEILALDDLPGVRVHGHVPDLDPFMDGCRIGLAPLRYGAGVKGKVNLSMAHGQPVVATPAAVEGMHLRDGIDVLVGADAQGFADAVLRLYDDRMLWETLSKHGIDNVERHFSFNVARDALRRVLG